MESLFQQILLLYVLFLSACISYCKETGVYYVIPSTGDQHCPIDQECHTLSYYAKSVTFPPNIALIFLEGEHILNDTFVMEGLENVILIGQGEWVQGFHWSVMQSTVVIRCTSDESNGFNISDTGAIHVSGLTLTSCATGLAINNSMTVTIHHLSCQNNSEKGLYIGISNTPSNIIACTVSILESSFSHNGCQRGSLFPTNKSDGNAVLEVRKELVVTNITVVSSNFSYGCSLFTSGGLIVYSTRTRATIMKFYNSLFLNNYGFDVGGLMIFVTRYLSVTTENCNFINNSRIISHNDNTGGMYLRSDVIDFNVSNCLFLGNHGDYSGGLLLYSRNYANFSIIDTVFSNNGGENGAAMCISAEDILYVLIQNVSVSNSYHNKQLPGPTQCAVYVFSDTYCLVEVSGIYTVNNNMTGLRLKQCALFFTNLSSSFINNTSGDNGGAIYVDQTSFITANDEAAVYFINNTAELTGGAIYSESKSVLEEDDDTLHVCTITWVNASFLGNYAKQSGNDIYGGRFYNCQWGGKRLQSDYTFKGHVACDVSELIPDYFPKPLSSTVSSDPLGVCLCDIDNNIDCYNRSLHMEVYPGQSINVSLVTVGLCGGISPGLLETRGNGVDVILDKSSQQTSFLCKQFKYQLKQQQSINGQVTIQTTSLLQLIGASVDINITFLQCPLGLQLVNTSGTCQCSIDVNGIECNASWIPHPIRRSGNNWLYYSHDYNCTVVHRNCPFDYCNESPVSLSLDESDLQCMYNRSGILCGECQPGLSLMLGSNRCNSCENKYLSLVIVFMIAGIGLVIFLMVCNLTVSVGTINGLLFYANVVKLNEAVFFPNGVSIPVLSQFIAWLNLDLGIQTCFFNGLDGYWKTWLHFVFPIYIWLIVVFIIIGCHYSGKLSRLCGNNAVPLLATLVLMAYSKLLRNIKNGLMMTTVKCDDTIWNVWSVDGNIGYLEGKHIPLFVVSLLFLLIGLIYTVLVFSSQWLQRYSGKCCKSSMDPTVKLKPLIDAYSGPYKDKYRFWTGLLLIIRVILTTTFSYTTGPIPQLNNYIIIIISGILIKMSNGGVYRDKRLNTLESLYLINLGIISLLAALSDHMRLEITYFITATSISISLLVFFATVLTHVYISIEKKYGNFFSCCRRHQILSIIAEEDKPLLNNSNEEELYSPGRIIQKRESLIFDFDE